MSPAVFEAVVESLSLTLRWLWLSFLVLVIFWLIRRLAALEAKVTEWPWWLPLLIGAVLAAASWRCGI